MDFKNEMEPLLNDNKSFERSRRKHPESRSKRKKKSSKNSKHRHENRKNKKKRTVKIPGEYIRILNGMPCSSFKIATPITLYEGNPAELNEDGIGYTKNISEQKVPQNEEQGNAARYEKRKRNKDGEETMDLPIKKRKKYQKESDVTCPAEAPGIRNDSVSNINGNIVSNEYKKGGVQEKEVNKACGLEDGRYLKSFVL